MTAQALLGRRSDPAPAQLSHDFAPSVRAPAPEDLTALVAACQNPPRPP
jgi:hypothetical protein